MKFFNTRQRRLVKVIIGEPINCKIQIENPSLDLAKVVVHPIFDDIGVEVARNLKLNLYHLICKY